MLQSARYPLHNPVDVGQHLIVPKPRNTIALALKPVRSLLIVPLMPGMLPPVQLDDQARLQANEICYIRSNRMLAAEPATRHLPPTQIAPKQTLGVRHLATQTPGIVRHPGCYPETVAHPESLDPHPSLPPARGKGLNYSDDFEPPTPASGTESAGTASMASTRSRFCAARTS